MSLESNGVDRVCSLWKILTWFRGTNFCTILARFALSVVTQPNCPKCIQLVQNAPKHEVRVQWGGLGAFVSENSDTTSGTNFCTTSACFARSLVRQTNGSKCTQIVRNTPKHEFRSQRGQSGVFVEKNSDTTSWHKLLHQFNPFCTEFCKAIKRSQMHPNSTTHTKAWV